MKFLRRSLFTVVLVLAGQTLSPGAHAEEPLVIQRGSFKEDGSFELSVKGPAHTTFYVEFSTDGKTYSGLTQAASSGVMVVFYTCNDKGSASQLTARQANLGFAFIVSRFLSCQPESSGIRPAHVFHSGHFVTKASQRRTWQSFRSSYMRDAFNRLRLATWMAKKNAPRCPLE